MHPNWIYCSKYLCDYCVPHIVLGLRVIKITPALLNTSRPFLGCAGCCGAQESDTVYREGVEKESLDEVQ